MISLSAIRKKCNAASYTRGNEVFSCGLVENMNNYTYQPGVFLIEADVEGSYDNVYETRIAYDYEEDEIIDYECECPAITKYDGMCKHCVGLALAYRNYELNNEIIEKKPIIEKSINTDENLQRIIYSRSMRNKAQYFQPGITGQIELEPMLEYSNFGGWKVSFKIGKENKYIIKNISEFIENIQNSKKFEYGKKLAFIHEKSAFNNVSVKIINFLEKLVRDNLGHGANIYRKYNIYTSTIKKQLTLNDSNLVEFLNILVGEQVSFNDGYVPAKLNIIGENPELPITLESLDEDGFKLTIPAVEIISASDKICIYKGNNIYCCSEEYVLAMSDLLSIGNSFSSTDLFISRKDMKAFCQVVLPELEKYTQLTKPDTVEVFEPEPCTIKIYLDERYENIICTAYAEYGKQQFNLMNPISVAELYRDIASESKVYNVIKEYFTKPPLELDYMLIPESEEEHVYQLLDTGIPQLQQQGEVYISDAIKHLQILQKPMIKVGVALKAGLLDISIESEGLSPEDIEGILGNYRRRKKYYRLSTGEYLQLEDNGLTAIAELADGLDIDTRKLDEGHIMIPQYRAFYLDQVLHEYEQDLTVKREQQFKTIIRNMKDVGDSDYEIPVKLNTTLRPYQKFGYRWLCTLAQLGFCGILADDMGLGKTVQMIAFLLAKKEENAEDISTLIVCPASLVYNWQNEINRFAPSLKVTVIVGKTSERKELINKSGQDIFLTSYDLLKRDIEEYSNIDYNYMVLDEAQYIKNHMTLAAKAVKAVKSCTRFALTGTPVENTLSELWSIFDYLMPGVLGTYKKFKKNYEMPIAAAGDDTISNRLQRMIRPFILRRLKKDVLKELPDKIEEVVYSKMETEQNDIYLANVNRVLQKIKVKSEQEFKQGKIQLLAELTRLRQICCDPSLVYDNYIGGASKVDTCLELIDNAVCSGNKVLLFSQFTTMLEIIQRELIKRKIHFYVLTGATSKESRNKIVEAFNKDTIPVFLISLKAGGTGLNLTAASVVIHFDPWWNMAAQNQATDRAHRIGQKQVVTVYKLIMKDTLEEKILKLQEKKAMLSDLIIADGSISETIASKEEFMEILKV